MKRLIILLPFIVGIIFQTTAQNFLELNEILNSGDIEQFTKKLDEDAEVSVLNAETYSKKEAEPILNDFFLDKSDRKYKAIHKGSSTKGGFYQIGELYANNNSYRTYLYSKQIGTQFFVQEFRIEKQ